MKPGWKTTEFWAMLIGQAMAVLVLLGVVATGDAANLEQSLKQAVGAVVTMVVSLGSIWKYIQSRTEVKTAEANAMAALKEEIASTRVPETTEQMPLGARHPADRDYE